MAPPASGLYQSRLLNFVSRQTRRWTEQGARTLRHLKVAATWAAQVLIYPVYAVVQATRLAGRQLHQVVETVLPRLNQEQRQEKTAPAPDRSLKQVMPIAQKFTQQFLREPGRLTRQESFILTNNSLDIANPEIVESLSSLSHEMFHGIAGEIFLQGIATLLETRSLVLVTSENLLLDILNPEQQWQLRQWIIWEIADYWSDLRSSLASAKRFRGFLPLPADRPQLLPPVRVFWRMVRWMQTSPLALALDLFQESALVRHYGQEDMAQFGEATFISTSATFWLTMEDLFESRQLGAVQSWHLPTSEVNAGRAIAASPRQEALPAASPNVAESVPMDRKAIGQSDSPPQGLPFLLKARRYFKLLPLKQALTAPPVPAVVPVLDTTKALPEAQSGSSLLPVSSSPTIASDWIEAVVVPVGYVKHPLERVLEWVDRLMFWLEEATIATGRWLKRHW